MAWARFYQSARPRVNRCPIRTFLVEYRPRAPRRALPGRIQGPAPFFPIPRFPPFPSPFSHVREEFLQVQVDYARVPPSRARDHHQRREARDPRRRPRERPPRGVPGRAPDRRAPRRLHLPGPHPEPAGRPPGRVRQHRHAQERLPALLGHEPQRRLAPRRRRRGRGVRRGRPEGRRQEGRRQEVPRQAPHQRGDRPALPRRRGRHGPGLQGSDRHEGPAHHRRALDPRPLPRPHARQRLAGRRPAPRSASASRRSSTASRSSSRRTAASSSAPPARAPRTARS